MAVNKTEVLMTGPNTFIPNEVITQDSNNFKIRRINPFKITSSDESSVAKSNAKTGLFGNNIIVDRDVTSAKTDVLPTPKTNAFSAVANYLKKINARVTDYDIAVNTVNRYLPSYGELLSIVESNPRIVTILEKEGLV